MTSQPKRGGHDEQVNKKWDQLLSELGSYELARRIEKLPSYKAYDQRYPYDSAGKSISLDELVEEQMYVDMPSSLTPEAAYLRTEETDEYLAGLPDNQRQIISMTIEQYTPAEIAEELGQMTSNSVRQNKYKALRTLNVPIKLGKRNNQKA